MRLLRNRRGQGMMEYVIIAAAVIVLAIVLINKIRPGAETKINRIGTAINQD